MISQARGERSPVNAKGLERTLPSKRKESVENTPPVNVENTPQ